MKKVNKFIVAEVKDSVYSKIERLNDQILCDVDYIWNEIDIQIEDHVEFLIWHHIYNMEKWRF